MKAIHLSEVSGIPISDLERCTSSAQAIHYSDAVARKLVGRLGDKIIDRGFLKSRENKEERTLDLVVDLWVIPPEYGNDVLRFARDVIKAHKELGSKAG